MTGKGDRQTLVFVHGFLGGSEQWQSEIAAFSDRFDVVAPDLPGFAGAADRTAPDTIGGFAEAVLADLDRRGVERFVLLGHSMGGMIAQEIAARAPERVERLVLYGTGPLGRMPERFDPLEQSLDRLSRDGMEATVGRIAATWLLHGEADPAFPLLCEIGTRASVAAAQAALLAMAAWDGRDALSRLTMPTLIIWGDHDRSYRWPQVESLWTGLPDAALAVVPGAAHAVHLEKPRLFQALLDDYLAA